MPSQDIAVRPFSSVLSVPSLLSGEQTLLLNALGPEEVGTLVDDDGLLEVNDPGNPTFNGEPLTYVGSGTAQPGVNVLGITVPLGSEVDVVVLLVDGQYLMHFPDGEPNLLGAVAVVLDISTAPYQIFVPVCIASGTMIATARGDVAVEELRPDDLVATLDHGLQAVRWIGRTRLRFAPGADRRKPVIFMPGSLAPDVPSAPLKVSPQHRVLLRGVEASSLFGTDEVLALARGLTRMRKVRPMNGCRSVTYHSLLFDRHEVIRANGAWVESFLPGPMAMRMLGPDLRESLRAVLPAMSGSDAVPGFSPARRILKRSEAEAYADHVRVGARSPACG